jgi:dCMP deaminase
MIIGLTGTIGAGKGTIAEFLKEKGFEQYSVRKFLKGEIKKRKLELNRSSMVDVANELREKNGESYIIEKLYSRAKKRRKNAVIESIRALGEVDFLRKKENFCLIAVDADVELRYKRVMERKSKTDKISFEKFLEDEKKEMFSIDPAKQSLSSCISLADYIFINNFNEGSKENSIEKARYEFVEGKKGFVNLITKSRRPSFEENFMMDAYIWGHRSTCLRREVGAVLSKDNVFVSQGYNGPSRGSTHCKDLGGCLREKLNIPSGQRDEICRGIHAEMNAIINSPTEERRKGSTMNVTTYPCTICSKIISNSGIKEIIYWNSYDSPTSKEILEEAKISVRKYSGVSPISYHRFWGEKNRGSLERIKD